MVCPTNDVTGFGIIERSPIFGALNQDRQWLGVSRKIARISPFHHLPLFLGLSSSIEQSLWVCFSASYGTLHFIVTFLSGFFVLKSHCDNFLKYPANCN